MGLTMIRTPMSDRSDLEAELGLARDIAEHLDWSANALEATAKAMAGRGLVHTRNAAFGETLRTWQTDIALVMKAVDGIRQQRTMARGIALMLERQIKQSRQKELS
jgi:hypothetical protein